jgi:anti-sigma factor RsiW
MTHLTEEQMILYCFGELDASVEATDHLADCAACRAELAELRRTLDLAGSVQPPARGPDYGAQVWTRIAPRLGIGRVPQARPRWQWLAVAAAAAVVLVGAFWLGRWTSEPGVEPVAVRVEAGQDPANRLMLVTLGDHFEQSQRILTEVSNAGAASLETGWLGTQDLLASNRLYRLTAERSGERSMAALLERLELVLAEVAHAEPGRLKELQKWIREDGILFELRVVNGQLETQQQALLVSSH